MLSPKNKRNISRILPFGLIWLAYSLIYLMLEQGILGDLDHYPSTGNPYDFSWRALLIASGSALISGLIVGTIEILYLNPLFGKKSLAFKIFYKTLIYVGIMVSFLLIVSLISNAAELQKGLFHREVWNNVWTFLSDLAFWSIELYLASIIGWSLFYAEVSENLGQGVLRNFMTGKYHTPIEEERVFMFLDMKSSTAIAEKLGHVQYFKMLKEYYADLSAPIIQYSGEIYQYVGDEMILSWKLGNGTYHKQYAECFFAMKTAMKAKAGKYQGKFGVLPEFKAGLHAGKVTTGEIGVIKKDIIFTGDVLNTTSRIQGLCNAYNVDILISGQLIKKMDLEPEFKVKALGEKELKGRNQKIELYTIFESASIKSA